MTDCILYEGPKTKGRGGSDVGGYGLKWFKGKTRLAHRVAYEQAHGPIPDGYHVDHLCHERACIEPTHLEAVTPTENRRRSAARIVACPHGHEYVEDNVYINYRGARCCRECLRREWREKSRRKYASQLPGG